MIKIENVKIYGWEAATRGMRNPMNSWEKSDSYYCDEDCPHVIEGTEPAKECDDGKCVFCVGANDFELMQKLVKAGSDHSKFMRMITVTMDVTAPRYWWAEYDTYKVGTVRNSCSTMHKIHSKKFTMDDFSCDHLTAFDDEFCGVAGVDTIFGIIADLNEYRKAFLKTNDKKYWWQIIQLLPQSYNQRATLQLNYAVLRNMYHSRKNHKLDEWHTFCEWIETLPYAKELICVE